VHLPDLKIDVGRLDLNEGVVVRDDVWLALTPREAEMLRYLVCHAGRDVPRSELLTEVWHFSASANTRAVDATARRIRKKIERTPGDPTLLLTVYGSGYRWAGPSKGATVEVLERAVALARLSATWEGWRTEPEQMADALGAFVERLRLQVGGLGGELHLPGNDRVAGLFDEPEPAVTWALGLASTVGQTAWPGRAPGVSAGVDVGRVLPVSTVGGQLGLVGPAWDAADALAAAAASGEVRASDRCRGRTTDLGWSLAGFLAVLDGPSWSLNGGETRHRSRWSNAPKGSLRTTGRHTELARLRQIDASVVVVCGPAGVGKTHLACAFARGTAKSVCWIAAGSLRTRERLAEEVSAVLELSSVDPSVVGGALAARGPLWLMLDDADHLDGTAWDTLDHWAEAGDLRVLVTARSASPGRESLRLAPLSDGDARALFLRRGGAKGPRAALNRLLACLDGLPLAIEIAAHRSVSIPLDALTERIENGAGELLDGVLAEAWAALDSALRTTLSELVVFRGTEFWLEQAEELLGAPDRDWIADDLAGLVGAGLLVMRAPGQYRLLRPVRRFVQSRAPLAVELRERHLCSGSSQPGAMRMRRRPSTSQAPRRGSPRTFVTSAISRQRSTSVWGTSRSSVGGLAWWPQSMCVSSAAPRGGCGSWTGPWRAGDWM